MRQILVFNAINTIVNDMEGNIRIDRLPMCHGRDRETDISTGPYHDSWGVCSILILPIIPVNNYIIQVIFIMYVFYSLAIIYMHSLIYVPENGIVA